jgi:hypothetical protein
VASLEKERDFYYAKLRDIEILLGGYEGPDAATAERVLAIMYASDDPDFVAPGPGEEEQGGGGVG